MNIISLIILIRGTVNPACLTIPFIGSANVWRICVMTSCARFVFWLRMFPTWRRGRTAPKFGYISPQRTILRPVATRAELWSHQRGGNTSNMLKHLTTQHAITLHKCKVFLLSDGGDSRGGAGGTASSKVPGNVKLPGSVDCNGHSSLTHLGLLSRTPATHCVSHAKKKIINFCGAPLSQWKRQETSTSPMSLSRAVINNNNTNNIINERPPFLGWWCLWGSLLPSFKTWEPCCNNVSDILCE